MSEQHDYSSDDLALFAALRSVTPADMRRSAPPDSVWDAIAAAVDEPAPSSAPAPPATVGRRQLPRRVVAIAAVAASIAAGVVVTGLVRGDESTTVVARAPLTSDGLEGAPDGLRGDAYVSERGDGRTLHVELDGLRPTSGEYLELWLITPDVSGMVSLGAARPDGDYELPAGLNVEDYPIVDVSTEPYDGDPDHSGGSLLRGVLDA